MNLGATNIATLKLGSQQVSRVMLGSVEVWANMDADAAAYIAAIEGDGITVSATQKSALDAFYRAGKADGWYSALKRMYLPIWAAATPNARCMVSGMSGSFVGGVTPAAGYVQGNGTNGYLNSGLSYGTAGLSAGSAMIGELVYAAETRSPYNAYNGCGGSGVERFSMGQGTDSEMVFFHPNTTDRHQLAPPQNGIFVGSSTATNARYLMRRNTSGVSSGSSTANHTTNVPNIDIFFMARNSNGAPTFWSNKQLGACFFGTGINLATAEDFTLALKTLWETCTGLTLP
jgi:hypothetical protein